MIIPTYWATSSRTYHKDGRSYTVRRLGWSDISQQSAQTHAQIRVDRAIDDVAYQWPNPVVPKCEPKTAYNGAEGVPIREEVIERHGDEVITRNGYGALCLNTPDIMFVDVDEDKIHNIPSGRLETTFFALLALGAALTFMFYRAGMGALWWWSWGLMVVLGPWLFNRAWRSIEVAMAGGSRGVVNRQLQVLQARDPAGVWALYQTPGGYRIMALHRRFDPSTPETLAVMNGFMADQLYALMCRKQGCFRARVSPKPWRMQGMERMRGPIWPVEGEALDRRRKWVDAYEKEASEYASCRFLELIGSPENQDESISQVRQRHDDMCQAHTTKPIA